MFLYAGYGRCVFKEIQEWYGKKAKKQVSLSFAI